MAGIKLNGKALSRELEKQLATRVEAIIEQSGRTPILATILVGDDPASATYVRMKGNACKRVGMASERVILPEETTTEELRAVIRDLNEIQTCMAFCCSTRFLRKSTNAFVLMQFILVRMSTA